MLKKPVYRFTYRRHHFQPKMFWANDIRKWCSRFGLPREVGSFASRAACLTLKSGGGVVSGDAVRVFPGRVLRARDGQAEFFAECAADESSDAVCLPWDPISMRSTLAAASS